MISINKGSDNNYCFKLKAPNGKILLTSISFPDKTEASKTVKYLHTNPPKELSFERKTNFEGKFLYNVKNKQGFLIGYSPLYSSEAGLENGISNLKKRIYLLSKTDSL
ncbi:hypothetical protein [Maribacter sp.]|uniref:hypothetical protein n=1 Tax=Maribacter sp. TaxID=1897614 RepID=UPI0025C41A5D|nr:hypothetical protein [Maribacter sp.]